MKTIEISNEVWNALQKLAEPFVDEPDDVLKRILGIGQTPTKQRPVKESTMRQAMPISKISRKEQGRRNRKKYLELLYSKGISLEATGKIFYLTTGGKRVAIPSATERKPGKWFLGMAASSFLPGDELFVILLCSNGEQFLDFVLPPSKVSQIAPQLSRDRSGQMKFNIAKRSDNNYELLLSGEKVLGITEFLHKVETLDSTRNEVDGAITSFPFTINKSFLETGRYPITIPKEVYGKLQHQGILSKTDVDGDKKQIKIVGTNGIFVVGHIYHGTAGYGPYYQIQLSSADVPSDFCSGLEVGEKINIIIEKVGGSIVVHLK